MVASLSRAISPVKGGSPARSPRIGSMLTRKPMSGASSARPRLALTVPTVMSVCPVERCLEAGHQRDEQRRALAPAQLAQPVEQVAAGQVAGHRAVEGVEDRAR